MGSNVVKPSGIGPYVFKIHGEVHHYVGPLHSDEPSYAQMYILDNAVQKRSNLNKLMDRTILTKLTDLMNTNNPFAIAFKTMYQIEQESIKKYKLPGNTIPNMKMILLNNEIRRHDLPTVNEIAYIFKSVDGAPPVNRDMISYLKNSPIINSVSHTKTHRINDLMDVSDPMVYPLLFPNGELGWNEYMRQKSIFYYL